MYESDGLDQRTNQTIWQKLIKQTVEFTIVQRRYLIDVPVDEVPIWYSFDHEMVEQKYSMSRCHEFPAFHDRGWRVKHLLP